MALRGALERVTVDESNGYSIDELLAQLRDLGIKHGGFQNGYAVNAVLDQRTEARKILSLPVPELAQGLEYVVETMRLIAGPVEFYCATGERSQQAAAQAALSRLDALRGKSL